MNLLRRPDPNRFSSTSLFHLPQVLCRRCNKPVDNVVALPHTALGDQLLAVHCHHRTRTIPIQTLDLCSAAYAPVLYAFEPASERGKEVRKRLSARRNGWRVTP